MLFSCLHHVNTCYKCYRSPIVLGILLRDLMSESSWFVLNSGVTSPADKCKFRRFDDTEIMKLGTKLEGIIINIFSCGAIVDLSRDPNGSHFKMTS